LKINRYAKVINLPQGEEKELPHVFYLPANSKSAVIKRKIILRLVAKNFVPDIAIFEHFPFGRGYLKKEISEFIQNLTQCGTLIYSSVRDIIDAALDEVELYQRLKLFNAVFVHSDKKMGFITSFRKFKALGEKIVFTDRIIMIDKESLNTKNEIKAKLGVHNKKLILLSIGGGRDGIDIVEKIIDIKNNIDKNFNTLLLISTGTSIGKGNLKTLRQRTRNTKDIIIKKFIPDFINYVKAADLFISMGGYNSVNNALFAGIRTIIFPRRTDQEQKIRTKYYNNMFSEAGSRMSSKELASRITNIMKSKIPARYKGNFMGAGNTARLIERIAHLDYLKIRLTTRCNCNCDMCSWKFKNDSLDYEKVKKIIQQAKLLNVKAINFTGGEPTIYPQLKELLIYAKKQNFYVSVYTNGLISHNARACLNEFSDNVIFSLDSHTASINDVIRGRRGAFKRTLNSIKYLSRRGKYLNMNICIRPDNFRAIHKMVDLFSGNINSMAFTLLDTSMNGLNNSVFKRHDLESFYFDEAPLILAKSLQNNIKIKINPFFKDLDNLNARQILKKIFADKNHYIDKLKSIFEFDSQKLCALAKNEVRINSDGKICPCCYLDDYPVNLGNINNDDFIDVVSSDAYFNFINSAIPGKGICRECKKGYRLYTKVFN